MLFCRQICELDLEIDRAPVFSCEGVVIARRHAVIFCPVSRKGQQLLSEIGQCIAVCTCLLYTSDAADD